MKVLSKVLVLAERNGWTTARAQGFVDGELARRRGAAPSIFARVGIDDYCMGFRAGYYVRSTSQPRDAATPLATRLQSPSAIAEKRPRIVPANTGALQEQFATSIAGVAKI
jgi:hypothetical protein